MVPGLHVEVDYSASFDYLLEEDMPYRHLLNSQTAGPISGDVQSRGVVDVQRYMLSKRVPNHSSFMMIFRAEHRLLHDRGTATSSASIVGCVVSPLEPPC